MTSKSAPSLLTFTAAGALLLASACQLHGASTDARSGSTGVESRLRSADPLPDGEDSRGEVELAPVHAAQPSPDAAVTEKRRERPRPPPGQVAATASGHEAATASARDEEHEGKAAKVSAGSPAESGAAGPSARPAAVAKEVGARNHVAPAPPPASSGNTFARVEANRYVRTSVDSLSTFAVDVDTASYTVARRYLENGGLPPPQAIRVEEFLNYFTYSYPQPTTGDFAVHLEGAPSPFARGKTLLKIGLQGRKIARSQRKPANLVFLVDTSGSMSFPDKLPLAVEALKILVKNLNEHDTIAITTYAGSTRDVLLPTPATDWQKIHRALDSLSAGGGTAMGSGLTTAYAHAMKGAGSGKVSRVIVLTDGDTNLGPNLTASSMLESVRRGVAEGVTLTTIGLGMGNYRDDLMEKLANEGNGNAFYIDSAKEARRVFETHLAGTLEVIAKDVKVQVDFHPEAVASYRLVGYENRDIADADFRNDKVDAGEIGAGHSVTALYEVELTGAPGALATVRVRAKAPTGSRALEQSFSFGSDRVARSLESASADLRFATAVAGTADILRASPDAADFNLARAIQLAKGSTNGDPEREDFVRLARRAQQYRTGDGSVARQGQ